MVLLRYRPPCIVKKTDLEKRLKEGLKVEEELIALVLFLMLGGLDLFNPPLFLVRRNHASATWHHNPSLMVWLRSSPAAGHHFLFPGPRQSFLIPAIWVSYLN